MKEGNPTMPEADRIRVIAFREGEQWVAQCLEYDIGTQAADLTELQKRLALAVDAERNESIARNGNAFEGIDPAPRRFHEMWEKAAGNFKPRHPAQSRDGSRVDFEMALCA